MTMEASLAKLLDFSSPFDTALLDSIVQVAYDPSHPEVRASHPRNLIP